MYPVHQILYHSQCMRIMSDVYYVYIELIWSLGTVIVEQSRGLSTTAELLTVLKRFIQLVQSIT